MDKNNIIQAVKQQEEEKVGFSLKLPAGLKDELQKIASDESISMNALIVATLQSLVKDECGKDLKTAKRHLMDYRTILARDLRDMQVHGVSCIEEGEECSELERKLKSIDDLLGV